MLQEVRRRERPHGDARDRRYGGGSNLQPNWVDIAVVLGFSLAIFYWAVSLSLSATDSATEVAKDAHQLAFEAGQE